MDLSAEHIRTIKPTDRIGCPPAYDTVILDARWRRRQAIEANRAKLDSLRKLLAENLKKGLSVDTIVKIIEVLEEMLAREAERDKRIYGQAYVDARNAKLAEQQNTNGR